MIFSLKIWQCFILNEGRKKLFAKSVAKQWMNMKGLMSEIEAPPQYNHKKAHADLVATPVVVKSNKGKYITQIDATRLGYTSNSIALEMKGFSALYARLVTFIEGVMMADLKVRPPELYYDLGRKLGTLDKILTTFEIKTAKRDIKWDLMNAEREIESKLEYVRALKFGPKRVSMIKRYLRRYRTYAKDIHHSQHLRECVVHNDANENNLLVSKNGKKVMGIIDFGDLVHTKLINNVAIAAAYAMMDQSDPIECLVQIALGYHQVFPLRKDEVEIMFHLSCLRICHSVTSAAYERYKNPENEYAQVSAAPGWATLQKLAYLTSADEATNRLWKALFNVNRDTCYLCTIL